MQDLTFHGSTGWTSRLSKSGFSDKRFFYEIKILLMQNKRFRTVKFIKFLISAPFYPVK